MRFDPASQDVGNIVLFEHVNLTIPNQETATDFYVAGLGLTRDPHMTVGSNNMWINAGRQQFHLPKGEAQRFRGTIGLVLPDLDALEARLRSVAPRLGGTHFSWRRENGHVALTCPWGNRFRAHGAGGGHGGPLGIPYLEMPVAEGTAAGIAEFYRSAMGAPAEAGDGCARVTVGPARRPPPMTGTMSRSTPPISPARTALSPNAAWLPPRTIPASIASPRSSNRARRKRCSTSNTKCGACTILSTRAPS